MKIIYIQIILSITLAACCSDSSSNKLQALNVPLGDEAIGVALEGPLAGKKMCLLREDINLPHCWKDSVHWTGSELFYAISSTNFTKLLAGIANEIDPNCQLPVLQSEFKSEENNSIKFIITVRISRILNAFARMIQNKRS